MALNVAGLISMIVFYLIVLATGFWAARKSKRAEARSVGPQSEIVMVGGRNLNIWVSIFTTTATCVGGGYIMGVAEITYAPNRGLVWAIAPLGFFVNLNLMAVFFVRPVRERNYVTIMDVFQEKYGPVMTGLLFIPYLMADVFWIGCILYALGGTIAVILDLSSHIAIVISTAVAILYTLLGGLYSVAYTDVIQLMFMLFGLWFCVPFAILSPVSADITNTSLTGLYQEPWVGSVDLEDLGSWIDEFLLVTIGSFCYQELYQRIFASPTVRQAQVTCCVSSVFCVILVIPSVIIGAVAASTDWNQTTYGLTTPFEDGMASFILPVTLQYLCPEYVSLVGIGALAAAVMSSIDSGLLSISSMFARNIFKNIIWKKASERQILLVVKAAILVVGVIGAALAMSISSVYGLFIMSGDMMYTVVCAQLLTVLFLPRHVNSYGGIAGLVTSLALRGLSGEPSLGSSPVWTLPGDRIAPDGTHIQGFPYRTAIFLISIATILLWSRVASEVFARRWLPQSWDVFQISKKESVTLRPKEDDDPVEERKLNGEQLETMDTKEPAGPANDSKAEMESSA